MISSYFLVTAAIVTVTVTTAAGSLLEHNSPAVVSSKQQRGTAAAADAQLLVHKKSAAAADGKEAESELLQLVERRAHRGSRRRSKPRASVAANQHQEHPHHLNTDESEARDRQSRDYPIFGFPMASHKVVERDWDYPGQIDQDFDDFGFRHDTDEPELEYRQNRDYPGLFGGYPVLQKKGLEQKHILDTRDYPGLFGGYPVLQKKEIDEEHPLDTRDYPGLFGGYPSRVEVSNKRSAADVNKKRSAASSEKSAAAEPSSSKRSATADASNVKRSAAAEANYERLESISSLAAALMKRQLQSERKRSLKNNENELKKREGMLHDKVNKVAKKSESDGEDKMARVSRDYLDIITGAGYGQSGYGSNPYDPYGDPYGDSFPYGK